jgi:hypothetical protein
MEDKNLNHNIRVNDIDGEKADDSFANFKAKLESVQQFPDIYVFKFIIPGTDEKLAELKTYFPEDEFIQQASKTRKYVSITVKKWMQNADDVIAIYQQVGSIKEVIML